MSTPALGVDCTGWTRALLAGAWPDVRVVTELPSNLADVVPVVRVFRIGGGDDHVVLDHPLMAFHGFAASDADTRALLYRLSPTFDQALGQARDGAVLTNVSKLSGPSWANYENPNLRHHVSLYYLRIKIAP